MIVAAIGPRTGKLVDIAADPLGWTLAFQDEADGAIVLVQLDPEGERRVPDVRLDGGGGNAFPVLVVDRGATWLAYRHGVTLHGVLRNLTASLEFSLGLVHGNAPIAFGSGFCAWQADATYMIQAYDLRSPGVVIRGLGLGRPTGLGQVRADGHVDLVDDLRFSVAGMLNPRRVGRVVVGENATGPDRNIARTDDGREAQLWPSLTSNTPRIATDGGAYAIATWGGPGVRLAIVTDQDFRAVVVSTPDPVGTPVSVPKVCAYWYDDGKWGRFAPKRNATITGAGLWATDDDNDGIAEPPEDVNMLLGAAIDRAKLAFIGDGDIARPTVAARWAQILGVYIHEPGDAIATSQAVSSARERIAKAGLAPRPIVPVLTPDHILDDAYSGIGDALSPEVYFDRPEADYNAQLRVARERIAAVCTALAPSPLYITVQAYDRSDGEGPAIGPWESRPDALEAIQQACNEAMSRDQVLGLWWFAYSRPGGVRTYPKLEAWHAAQVAVTPAPPLPSAPPPKPTHPPETHVPEPIPGQAEFRDFMTFLHEVCYQQELQRAGGLFESPDPHTSRIFDPRAGDHVVVMDDAAMVWLGEYTQAFRAHLTTPGGPHEAAKAHVRAIIHNSDEARQKRGDTGPTPAVGVLAGPISVAGKDFATP